MEKLRKIIISRIKEHGPITFCDFMETALYHPRLGYYNQAVEIGKNGDFYTSSNVSRLFGCQLAKEIKARFAEKTIDEPFHIVEFGAGSGQLAADILTELGDAPEFREIRYIIVEKSAKFIQDQKEKLKKFPKIVKWLSLDELIAAPVFGIIILNEVIDAFAVHRVVMNDGKLREIYLDYQDEFREITGRLSTLKLSNYLDKYGVRFSEGQQGEINLTALAWLENAVSLLRGGYLITIDYGALAAEIYSAGRFNGTLNCYYQHKLISDPYRHIGRQDITAHVNFTALIDKGEELGFKTLSLQPQSKFLISRGILDDLEEINRSSVAKTEKLKAALAVKQLIMPNGMGERFQVLIQQKGTL